VVVVLPVFLICFCPGILTSFFVGLIVNITEQFALLPFVFPGSLAFFPTAIGLIFYTRIMKNMAAAMSTSNFFSFHPSLVYGEIKLVNAFLFWTA